MKIFILGHSAEALFKLPPKPFLQPVNLAELVLPIPNTNDLAENRFFMLDKLNFKDCPEYIGVLTNRFNEKYKDLIGLDSLNLIQHKLKPHVVYAADPTAFSFPNWVSWSCVYHKTYEPYLKDLAAFMGLPLVSKPTFWANNFICHKNVFLEFIDAFQKVFFKMHAKYGYDFNMYVEDQSRVAAYVYERVAMIYFANRPDLSIVKLPNFLDQIMFFGSSTENYAPLTQIWRDSLLNIGVKPENIKHSTFSLPSNYRKDVQFQTKEYAYCIERKVHYIIQHLKQYKAEGIRHQYCVMADCDLMFFPNRSLSWKDLFSFMEVHDGDLYLPYENHNKDVPQGNTGFVMLKTEKIDAVLAAYEKVHEKIKNAVTELNKHGLFKSVPYVDQTIINECDLGIKIVLLPSSFAMHGADHSYPFKQSALFHHAIGATNVPAKVNQMMEAWNMMN